MHSVRVNLATETYDVAFWRSHTLKPGAMGHNLWAVPNPPGIPDASPKEAVHRCIDAHIARATERVAQSRHVDHLIENIRTLRLAFGKASRHPGRLGDRARMPILQALCSQLQTLHEIGTVDPLFCGPELSLTHPSTPSCATLETLRRQCRAAVHYYAEVTEAAHTLQIQQTRVDATVPCYRDDLQSVATQAQDTLNALVQNVLLPDAKRLQQVAVRLAGKSDAACFEVITAHVAALQNQLQTMVYPAVIDALPKAKAVKAVGDEFLPVLAMALANHVKASQRLAPCVLGAVTVGASIVPKVGSVVLA